MAINAKDFTFCNKKLSDFGFIIANFDSSSDDSATCGNIELITARPPASAKNIIHGVSYGDPISLTFQIVKFDFSKCICSENPVTNEEQENLMRWLIKTNYNYINFDDGDVYFNVTMNNITPKKIGGVIRGFEITATNDSVYSYSQEHTTFLVTGNNIFTDNSSVIGYTYPVFRITTGTNGDVIIKHQEDNRTMAINNCVSGEVLTIDCEHGIIQSSVSSHDMSKDFNFVFLRFFNSEDTRDNTISIKNGMGNMFYRFKRMVVI